ncbi:ElaA protein [Hathewaya proteolytica DSM 3090]|uniref:ElaA protein n=1 Tax=Hathewaya proteolytica DSM 3090 TaxID=1121331 RepID=A0A1M6SD91_9CLOT|nr:GNAT family N-acetyltransferase [Hathewaya proteolytica]SHK42744.1 ElaA protein [Hathewaya proteolytica DSM 3090]
MLNLCIKKFDELTIDELYEILKIRVDVFVVEQSCPYGEIDGRDKSAYHVFLKDEEGIQAYLRVLDRGVSFDEVSIGRVLTLKRRCGLGSRIINEGIRVAEKYYNADKIKIEAQTYAKTLYEKAGFKQSSDEFLEDGIPHIEMIWQRTKEL